MKATRNLYFNSYAALAFNGYLFSNLQSYINLLVSIYSLLLV